MKMSIHYPGRLERRFLIRSGYYEAVQLEFPALFGNTRFHIGGEEYVLRHHGVFAKRFSLEGDSHFATAEKSRLIRRFEIRSKEGYWLLRNKHVFSSRFVIEEQGRIAGNIPPRRFFHPNLEVEMPDAMPFPVQVFTVWLLLFLWRVETVEEFRLNPLRF